jgi:hypothetical protein
MVNGLAMLPVSDQMRSVGTEVTGIKRYREPVGLFCNEICLAALDLIGNEQVVHGDGLKPERGENPPLAVKIIKILLCTSTRQPADPTRDHG